MPELIRLRRNYLRMQLSAEVAQDLFSGLVATLAKVAN
jgi:hypothetical protein